MYVADAGQYLAAFGFGLAGHADIAAAGPNPDMTSVNF
jgi:hypothetical protein